jgi:ferredoxin
LLSFKTTQFFELHRKSNFQVPTPILTDNIVLPVETYGKKFVVVGEFPRRVEIGEVLLKNGEFKVISPVNGIATYDTEKVTLNLRIDGELNFKPTFEKKDYTFLELKSKLDIKGLVSFDFSSLNVSKLLDSFTGKEGSKIVFAPFTSENFIDYKSRILEKYRVEFDAFKTNLTKIFHKSTVFDFISEKKEIDSFSYPDGKPRYFLYKYCQEEMLSEVPLERILYLGPETIFHILLAIYHNIPLHERIVSVTIINKKGLLEGESKIYRIKNGTNLTEFLNLIRKQYGYKYFTINSFYEKQPVYEIGADFVFDLFKHHSLIICEQMLSGNQETICIDCNDCSYFCPVSANPRALLDKDNSDFNKDICIDCGLCSVFCPSQIDFSSKILAVKGEIPFAIS